MCHKKIFSERQAEAALERAARSKNPDRKECRSYYCHNCKGWHLTSHEYNGTLKNFKVKFKKKWNELLKLSA